MLHSTGYRRKRWVFGFTCLGLFALTGASTRCLAQGSGVQFVVESEPARTNQEVPQDSDAADERKHTSDAAASPAPAKESRSSSTELDWLRSAQVGYDRGFVITSQEQLELGVEDKPFSLKMNGWGQLRHSLFDTEGPNQDLNQFQLKRGRLIFSGSAFTTDFAYFVQLDGRSSSGDNLRLLDYYMTFDLGRHLWGCEKGVFGIQTGKYKMPFTMARHLSGREFEFTDRSMASTFFDVNRSLAIGLYGKSNRWGMPVNWETAVFNGLVTGGAETGSSGALDNNFAYSARVFAFPTGNWRGDGLADFQWHRTLATRIGCGFANSTIDRDGSTEFDSIRVVDSGVQLKTLLDTLLPSEVAEYNVNLFCVDVSCKWQGWSATVEYYFRNINGFEGASVPDLFDHGFWLQLGKFVIPDRFQLFSRWSRVVGNSGRLGAVDQSADEVAGGFAWYFRDQHAKVTFDATHLNGAPIDSASLDISPGDSGWLFRSQIQFAF